MNGRKIDEKEKIPYMIMLEDEALFSMAGIWDSWKDNNGEQIHSFSIITTTPNKLMENIHNRMPVILNKEDEKTWLENDDTDFLKKLLVPYDDKRMTAYPISKMVNSPANDKPEIRNPVEYDL